MKALREISGITITVVSIHKPFTNTFYYWEGIPVHPLGSSSAFSKISLWKKTYQTLNQIHRKNPITTLHSFWLGECAFIGHWFSKKNNVKHLTTLMGQDALKGNGYSKILPLKKMQLITLSDFHQKTFLANCNVKTEIIPWGINPADCNPSAEKTIDIIGVGYLNKVKNHALFIDVISEINQKKPIKVVLIGEGNQYDTLKKKIKLLKLEDVIELKRLLPYNETMRYMAQSKVLLHTSHYESFGLVFAEALQSKTMIVSKNTGCIFETQNWTAATTKKQMVEVCKSLLSKSYLETEKNPFLIENTVQHYLKIYDN
ncbi:hypothetical protein FEDK69T_13080 [Flavobacterium enshiense DK69]|nr:hypothetical protein FEDK69T_13080 [Flavobacterium enshiense DK69]